MKTATLPAFSRWINLEHMYQSHIAKENQTTLARIDELKAEHDAAIDAGDCAKAGRIDRTISELSQKLLK